ncbi:MAG: thiamine phosphate synthase [Zoogloeaceae bacterium]|jgi:thiamine-phosphate pyrophosphorylase|nr:thiamine phosphate synthase [Zoogloeaceae bacterium]
MTQTPSHPPLSGLYAVTPDEPDTDRLLDSVRWILAGGCRWVQYRNKTADDLLRQRQAGALNNLCRTEGAALIVNDDVRLAREVGAAGVHLGRDDASPEEARKMLGDAAIIGLSCYRDLGRAERFAQAYGMNEGGRPPNVYLAFGAAYPSLTKPEAPLAAAGIFRDACRFPLPVCAIGGIALENAEPLIRMGVAMVAVIHDIFSRPAAEITARVFAYQKLFEESRHA